MFRRQIRNLLILLDFLTAADPQITRSAQIQRVMHSTRRGPVRWYRLNTPKGVSSRPEGSVQHSDGIRVL